MDRFVRFANMHMNDTTYLLEESLTMLAKIFVLERELEAHAWDSLTPEERADKEKELNDSRGNGSFSTQYGKTNVTVLKEWTADVRDPFLATEIVDRLAAMLCHNLATLVGPQMQDLKVKCVVSFTSDPPFRCRLRCQPLTRRSCSPQGPQAVRLRATRAARRPLRHLRQPRSRAALCRGCRARGSLVPQGGLRQARAPASKPRSPHAG